MADEKDYSGACWNALMEAETKESIAKLYIDSIDERNRRRSTDAAARLVVEALRAYMQWEAGMVMDNKVWRPGEERGDCLPTFTQELWDRFIAIQFQRNTALAAWDRSAKG